MLRDHYFLLISLISLTGTNIIIRSRVAKLIKNWTNSIWSKLAKNFFIWSLTIFVPEPGTHQKRLYVKQKQQINYKEHMDMMRTLLNQKNHFWAFTKLLQIHFFKLSMNLYMAFMVISLKFTCHFKNLLYFLIFLVLFLLINYKIRFSIERKHYPLLIQV